MMDPGLASIQGILYGLVAVAGTATVLVRDPRKQLLVYVVFGLLLTVLFFSIKAPDVAYSELVVGAGVVPLMVLLAIMKTSKRNEP